MILLLIYILAISLYDLRFRRIPNWLTIPIIVAGLILRFPGHIDLWLASFVLFSAWANHWMGAGDVKLWLALLWILPVEYSSHSFLIMCIAFFATGLIQTFWRFIRRQSLMNVSSAAAWRTIPFILLCWHVH
jgi:Flp pilus assembly protein protease CpaA